MQVNLIRLENLFWDAVEAHREDWRQLGSRVRLEPTAASDIDGVTEAVRGDRDNRWSIHARKTR
jgi:hypothetical protein